MYRHERLRSAAQTIRASSPVGNISLKMSPSASKAMHPTPAAETWTVRDGGGSLAATGKSGSELPLRAPRLAGSPLRGDADLISLLTTGQWRGGQRLRAPMPQFRMSTEDAQAVVVYLRSLSPEVSREP